MEIDNVNSVIKIFINYNKLGLVLSDQMKYIARARSREDWMRTTIYTNLIVSVYSHKLDNTGHYADKVNDLTNNIMVAA